MKSIVISVLMAMVVIGGALMLKSSSSSGSAGNAQKEQRVVAKNNVSIVEGKQVIEIGAKGGYQPEKSIAKAGIPTIIRFTTQGTFDCSAAVSIPSKGVNILLPQSGTKDVDIGVGTIGTLSGSCGMGMYPFEVEFN